MFWARAGLTVVLLMVMGSLAHSQSNPGFQDGQPLCANVPNPLCPGAPGLNQAFAGKLDFGSSVLGTLFTNNTGPLNTINTTVPASFATPAFSFNDLGTTGLSAADANTHFAFVVIGNSPPTGPGSYTAFIAQQYGDGRGAASYVTGAQLQAIAVRGGGNITGSNPQSIICGTAITGQCPYGAASVGTSVGEEVNTFSYAGAAMVSKEGVRIYDLGTVQAAGLSAGVVIGKGGPTSAGFKSGIFFGDPNVGLIGDNNFPLAAGGTLIEAQPTAVFEPGRGIDFSSVVGFTSCAICVPAGNGSFISFGPSGGGGRITSDVTSGGANLIFGSNLFAIQFSGTVNALIAQSSGNIVLGGGVNAVNIPTGTPVASLCLDAGGNIVKKTTTGPCL